MHGIRFLPAVGIPVESEHDDFDSVLLVSFKDNC
jgi:hypothetical protein